MMKRYLEFIKRHKMLVIILVLNQWIQITIPKDEIKSMIEKTIEAGGGEYKSSFINSFIQNLRMLK
jgi:hypothetical protein